jgi:hypothetical protein
MIQALAQHTNREHFDTPEYAVKPLLDEINGYFLKDTVIWECTDTYGKSGIASAFRKDGFKVESTNFDFLNSTVTGDWDIIVTNPPFRKKDDFIEKCIWYGKPFALLMPLTALEGIRRHALWKQVSRFGLIVLDRRVEFTGEGVWFNTSWFTGGIFSGVRFAKL